MKVRDKKENRDITKRRRMGRSPDGRKEKLKILRNGENLRESDWVKKYKWKNYCRSCVKEFSYEEQGKLKTEWDK